MKTFDKKMYKSVLKFLVPLTPEETYVHIVNEAIKLVNAKYGSIVLEQNGILNRVYSSYQPLMEIVSRKNGFTEKVFKSNKPSIVKIKDIAKVHPVIAKTHALSDMILPLAYQNKAIGIIAIISKRNQMFTKKDVEKLKLFLPFATLAIKKSQAFFETKQALETRDLFISMASHELKTPLTSMNVSVQLIQKKIYKREAINPKWVLTLLNELQRLRKLVKELLQVDQIQIGKFQYDWQKCNIAEVAQEAIRTVEASFPNHSFFLKNKTDKNYVYGDFDKLIQVFNNLLGNAAKFSSKKSEILFIIELENSFIKINIIDSGKGIDFQELPKIFERFYRGSNNQHQGMGLGLFLTREIVEAHRGKIQVYSTLNKGTRVEILLPKYT